MRMTVLSKLTVGILRGWDVANKRVWPRVDHRKTSSTIGFVNTSLCKNCWNTSSINRFVAKKKVPKSVKSVS